MAALQAARTGMARLKAWGPRARAERTSNMAYMVVTLEVSKLSRWLKADAAEGKAGEMEGTGACREAGGPVVWWRHDKRHARGKGPTQGLGAKGTRGAHSEHGGHAWYEPGGGRAWGVVAAHKRHARGRPDLRLGGQGLARSAH
jgi:hypothetical protein